ncbi:MULTISPECIES: DUF2550 family protein [Cellulomonas]|uniref:DUF2550 family protein n=1 Tax=Cellulomonas TaxID=1707 RepID=UPI0006257572|nr:MULTISPECIES: DUF2550 family protein [Cellulomonas]
MSGQVLAVVAGVVAVLVLALVALWFSRTRTLARRVGSFGCVLTEANDPRPARGTAQYGATRLYWWRRVSVMPRPARTWSRYGLVVLERSVLPPVPGRPQAVVAHCRVVPTAGGPAQEVRLQMSVEAYAGFTSWIEATPSRVGTII